LIFLKSSAVFSQDQELDPVVVSGSLSAQKSRETGRNIIVIRQEEIRMLPANSLDEILKFIPGIEVQQRGPQGAQSDIVIRGGTFQQVLVVIDGIRINDPLTGHFNSYIPIHPNDIDRIEVLKGASSAVFGADAVGGVINIITKKDSQIGTSWSGNMMNAGTNPLRWGGDLMWTLAEKKWNIFAAADYRRFDIEGFRVGEIRTILKDSLTYMPSKGIRDYRDFQYSLRAGGSFYPKSTDVFNWSAYVGEKQTDRMANLNYQEYLLTMILIYLD
jgi:outer membrane receptor protein involved in Fe transport